MHTISKELAFVWIAHNPKRAKGKYTINRDIEKRTEYQDDRYDDLDAQIMSDIP